MRKVPAELERQYRIACQSDSTVLITGPTGVGKTCLARMIHVQGRRRFKPFASVNLASLHEGTLESELFGHERGAFTSADSRRVGRLETAQGGTVFLDEVGELPLRLQARLLEFLQSRVITPVGSNREIRLDVRVIAATHRDLGEWVEQGKFREDLFHRLRVLSLELRPLSDRADEFDALLHQCLEDACESVGKSVLSISEEVARRFEEYHWPGNLRELKNVLEYAVLASESKVITAVDLPRWFINRNNRSDNVPNGPSGASESGDVPLPLLGTTEVPLTLNFHRTLSRFEKEYLGRALRRYGGRVNRTAKAIGMNKTTLIRRMREYGLSSVSIFSQ